MKILIVGGYGTFGSRLVELLCGEPGLTLLVAGRSLVRAEAFCRRESKANLIPSYFDRDGDLQAQLAPLKPDIVVDASGPFQAYGEKPYALAEAAFAAGADYLDLADGVAYVRAITQIDGQARARGRVALSGLSTVPALSAAVARHLAVGLTRIEHIAVGIAPSPHAPVGLSVIKAIAGYAGQPIDMLRDAKVRKAYALIDSRTMQINIPGIAPLRPIRFALVDVPDLLLLRDIWPDIQSVWVGAGVRPALLHRLLWCCAWLVRWGALDNLRRWAGLMRRVLNKARWGEDRGGMIVTVSGEGEAGFETRSWHLIAEGNDGPMIPAMAAAAIIRRYLAGTPPQPGARPAHGELELGDFLPLMAGRAIETGVRVQRKSDRGLPLYPQVMGSAFERLAEPLKALHWLEGTASFGGRADIARGQGYLANLVCRLVGFPEGGENVPVTVAFSTRNSKESWRRTFAGKSFVSTQELGRGRRAGLLVERFGPMAFGLAVLEDEGRLRLTVRDWSFLGIPLPARLAPGGEVFEHGDGGRFNFSVAITFPLIGLLVHYRGWLVPAGA